MSRLKYHDHMTESELAAFDAELDRIDACYASQPEPPEPPEDWEDEDDALRKAALNRVQP